MARQHWLQSWIRVQRKVRIRPDPNPQPCSGIIVVVVIMFPLSPGLRRSWAACWRSGSWPSCCRCSTSGRRSGANWRRSPRRRPSWPGCWTPWPCPTRPTRPSFWRWCTTSSAMWRSGPPGVRGPTPPRRRRSWLSTWSRCCRPSSRTRPASSSRQSMPCRSGSRCRASILLSYSSSGIEESVLGAKHIELFMPCESTFGPALWFFTFEQSFCLFPLPYLKLYKVVKLDPDPHWESIWIRNKINADPQPWFFTYNSLPLTMGYFKVLTF